MKPILISAVAVLAAVVAAPVRASEVVLLATRDNTLYSESGNESNGAGAHFFAGTNGQTQIRRGLLRFDVEAEVPTGSTITYVELTLSMSRTNTWEREVRLHRVLADWGEGTSNAGNGEGSGAPATTNDATWMRRFYPSTSWATNGGDFDPVISAARVVDQIGIYKWNGPGAVADVQGWLDTPATNFGWLLQNENESDTPTAKRFDSRQYPDAALRPRLRVVFDPPCAGSAANYCVAAPNSTGQGATMSWSGSLSVAANAFTLGCAQLPPNTPYVFYFGPQPTQAPFGNGFRCITGTLSRLNPPATASVAGAATRFVDLTSPPALGNITPGSTVHFQCWYRNPAGGGEGFNLSDGLAATFCN